MILRLVRETSPPNQLIFQLTSQPFEAQLWASSSLPMSRWNHWNCQLVVPFLRHLWVVLDQNLAKSWQRWSNFHLSGLRRIVFPFLHGIGFLQKRWISENEPHVFFFYVFPHMINHRSFIWFRGGTLDVVPDDQWQFGAWHPNCPGSSRFGSLCRLWFGEDQNICHML
jgi:hypothetical protein